MRSRRNPGGEDTPQVAANGLLDRRALLGRGAAIAGAMSAGVTASLTGAAAEPLTNGPWSLAPGVPVPPYGQPSKFESKVVRTISNPKLEPRNSAARTPHQFLNGIITPNGLHFVISRGGETNVDPDQHRFVIHGMVKQPMEWTVDALHRYPMVSRITFLECGGNSAPLYSKEPVQASVQAIHGLTSCAEWTGVMLSTLLDEVGIDPKAKWLIAEGADLPTMNRSFPITKAMNDAMIALYQNGEALNPSNGYPMRLLLPGYEGNMNVKWLRRIKVVNAPVMAINETKQYTLLLASGKAWQFYYPQEVKSFITRPSPGFNLQGPGFHEISGLAYSGNGRISKVEVSGTVVRAGRWRRCRIRY
jgi:sulfane dehydrogenase subunit SoxC